jgi:5-methyltetrahydropteroyltriglutamate--homocysteine methyltransferase
MLETTIAGSLPKPAWLAEPEKLWAAWRREGAALDRAKKDATLVWLKERAGVDIVSDGEQSRIHFVHGFLEKIEGIDWTKKTRMGIRDNRYVVDVPTVTAPVRRRGPVQRDEAAFTRGYTDRRLKFTAARADDHLRYHRRCALRAARRHGDGLRRGSEPRSLVAQLRS